MEKLWLPQLAKVVKEGKADGGQKARVALDVDVVTAHIHLPILKELQRRTGQLFTLEDINKYNTGSEGSKINLPLKEFLEIYEYCWTQKPKEIPIMLDANRVIYATRYYDIDFFSKRPLHLRDSLMGWLDYQGLGTISAVVVGYEANKAEYSYSIYIDDEPDTDSRPGLVRSIASLPGKFLMLTDRKYNRYLDDYISDKNNILRVGDGNEAIEILINVAES